MPHSSLALGGTLSLRGHLLTPISICLTTPRLRPQSTQEAQEPGYSAHGRHDKDGGRF